MSEKQRPAVQGAKARDRLPAYNLEAELRDMQSARLALEALGKAGIEGDNISVTGAAADKAAEPPDANLQARTREIDATLAKHMLRLIGIWTVGGVVGGALLGIPISIGLMAILGADITLERVIVGVFLSALALGIVSWLIPHTSYGAQAAPPWELTFAESAEGPVTVGVHSGRLEDVQLAEQALQPYHPRRIRRISAAGKPL